MQTPSIRALRTLAPEPGAAEALKRILTASRATLQALPAGAARARECYYQPRTSDLRLTCLDAALGTYGVECFETRKGELVEYLNAGDTYTPTIVRWRGNYSVRCWGDIAERHGIND